MSRRQLLPAAVDFALLLHVDLIHDARHRLPVPPRSQPSVTGTDDQADLDRDDGCLAAGAFSEWLAEVQAALRGERAADVPCGTCTACCAASQFIHIAPDERDALAHIPRQLLFPAPRLPRGHVLLGYDEHGRCPMLTDSGCSIYEHRPRTCRTYDCRVFAAAGLDVDADDATKASVAQRVRRWRFDHPTDGDRLEHAAVEAAAAFLRAHVAELPDELTPTNTTQLAVLAVELHGAFLGRDAAGRPIAAASPQFDAVRVEITRLATHRRPV